MIRLSTSDDSNILFTTSSGTLDKNDYDTLLPIVENKILKYGKVRWYFEMDHFDGWKLDAFWKDIKFDVRHFKDFEKVAMVGDKRWQEWMVRSIKPFIPAEIKYFNLSEKDLAEQWIRQ
jgi:hypothetical protein